MLRKRVHAEIVEGTSSAFYYLYDCDPRFFLYLGTLSVEAIYQDRDQFAQLVREVAAPDVGRMGIEILSFTIKDVYDNVEYLASLGRAQTANVKRDADIGVAEANRDAGIRVSVERSVFEPVYYACFITIQ